MTHLDNRHQKAVKMIVDKGVARGDLQGLGAALQVLSPKYQYHEPHCMTAAKYYPTGECPNKMIYSLTPKLGVICMTKPDRLKVESFIRGWLVARGISAELSWWCF